MSEKTLRAKIQELRARLSGMELMQTGYNPYAKFKYYQLEDFLPTVNKLCNELGMMPNFSIVSYQDHIWDASMKEYIEVPKQAAELKIYDTTDGSYMTFQIPTAEVRMGGKERNPIQELGAANTYLKRYLYMNFLELSEGDAVDATIGKENKPTYKMLKDFQDAYKDHERKKIREYYQVDTDDDLPRDAVKKYISDRKDVLKQKNEENALDIHAPRKDFY